jgi:hypothetical protein
MGPILRQPWTDRVAAANAHFRAPTGGPELWVPLWVI